MLQKVAGPKNFFVKKMAPKNLGSEKILGPKKLWVPKKFWVNNNFGPKKCMVRKIF